MNVQAILATKGVVVETINRESTIAAAIDLLSQKRIGVLVVCEDAKTILGIISERDIVTGLAKHGASLLDMSVAAIMTQTVRTCAPSDSVTDVMAMMTNRRIRHVPVTENNQLCGMVSIGDAVKHRLKELETETGFLRDYISH
ncbi:MAG: CBS domain-containing protein [Alphaproteobacteria bacterium]|nr:CBS domain-containing protein [Alphaproteobacteria bacterium]